MGDTGRDVASACHAGWGHVQGLTWLRPETGRVSCPCRLPGWSLLHYQGSFQPGTGRKCTTGQAVKKHQTQMMKNKSISKISCPWVHLHTQTFSCFYCPTAQSGLRINVKLVWIKYENTPQPAVRSWPLSWVKHNLSVISYFHAGRVYYNYIIDSNNSGSVDDYLTLFLSPSFLDTCCTHMCSIRSELAAVHSESISCSCFHLYHESQWTSC